MRSSFTLPAVSALFLVATCAFEARVAQAASDGVPAAIGDAGVSSDRQGNANPEEELKSGTAQADGGLDLSPPSGDTEVDSTEVRPTALGTVEPAESATSGGPATQQQAVAVTSDEQSFSVVSAESAARPAAPRLPIFGLGADVGLPDGANASLVIRPLKWARFQVAMGSNSISRGVRVGASLVPLGDGPGLVAEYGHYWDGNANGLVARLAGDGYQSSPVLERVGYDYFNLHLGLNFGYQRVTFFIQGGLSVVRGHLNRSDPTVYGPGNVQVAVLDNPSFKSTGIAGKLGLLVYVW